jgi:hypothetical protein
MLHNPQVSLHGTISDVSMSELSNTDGGMSAVLTAK